MKRADLLDHLREVLRERRSSLRRSLNNELAMLAGHDDDEPYEDTVFSRVSREESNELAAIEEALASIEEGHYGVCQTCAGEIAAPRLKALPFVSLCVDCQRKRERQPSPGLT